MGNKIKSLRDWRRANQGGFSLMEVTIAVGISAVVVMVAGTTMTESVKSIRESNFKRDKQQLVDLIRSNALNNKERCMEFLDDSVIVEANATTDEGQPLIMNGLGPVLGVAGDLEDGADVPNYNLYLSSLRFSRATSLGLDGQGRELFQGQIVAMIARDQTLAGLGPHLVAEPVLAVNDAGQVEDCQSTFEIDPNEICDNGGGGAGCISFYDAGTLDGACAGRGNFTNGIKEGAEGVLKCDYDFATGTCPAAAIGARTFFVDVSASFGGGTAGCRGHTAIPPFVN